MEPGEIGPALEKQRRLEPEGRHPLVVLVALKAVRIGQHRVLERERAVVNHHAVRVARAAADELGPGIERMRHGIDDELPVDHAPLPA